MRSVVVAALLSLWTVPAFAQDTPPPEPSLNQGGPGESCRARADCQVGLLCVNNVCTTEAPPPPPLPAPPPLTQPQPYPQPYAQPYPQPYAQPYPQPYAQPYPQPYGYDAPPPLAPVDREWDDFAIGDGIHFYAGMSFYPGFMFIFSGGQTSTVWGSFMYALKLGVLFDNTALELEISPVTWLPVVDVGTGIFQMNLGIGTYNELTDNVFWPTRFALGFAAVNTAEQFVIRADMLGLAFNVGHVLIDLHFPSIRSTTDFDTFGTFNFLFGAGVSYVF